MLSIRASLEVQALTIQPHIHDDWSAEIQLLLRVVVFKLTMWDHNASYGASLQGLRYTDARATTSTLPAPRPWQKSMHALLSVGGRYAWSKWENWLLERESNYDHVSGLELKSTLIVSRTRVCALRQIHYL